MNIADATTVVGVRRPQVFSMAELTFKILAGDGTTMIRSELTKQKKHALSPVS